VHIQVLPNAAGELSGSAGPFTIFDFADQPSIAIAEGRRVGRLIDQKDELAEIALAYDLIRAAALPPESSIGMIVGTMGQIWTERI
jgi:hypothetical protein